MKNRDTTYITIGKIGSPYGIQGWLKIYTYTEYGANILQYSPWYLTEKDGWQPVQVEEGRVHGKGVVAKLAHFHTPEEARLLTGKTIAVQRTQLPALKKDEYYWSDLQGLTVINKGQALGKIIYLIATGSNDVLVVKGEKEHAIPYLPDKVIKKVDIAKQEIHVDWEVI